MDKETTKGFSYIYKKLLSLENRQSIILKVLDTRNTRIEYLEKKLNKLYR